MNKDCENVLFTNKAYNSIINEAFRGHPNETGGILLGHILDNGMWLVMEVIPPGWNSIFKYAYFEYDERFVNYLAQSVATEYEQEPRLLGLWHRHPGSMDTFSGTDDGTNRTFASLCSKGAISGLVNIDPNFRLTMYHVSNPLKYEKINIEVVDDDMIPEEYQALKYFPIKGMHPEVFEKKNDKTNSEKEYVIGSEKKKIHRSNRIVDFLNSTNLFLLVFLVGLTLSLGFSYSYMKVEDIGDFKSLHKIAYCVSPSKDDIDSVRKISPPTDELGKDKRAEAYSASYRKDFYNKLTSVDAVYDLKLRMFLLWGFTILSLLIAIFLRKIHFFLALFSKKRYWFQKNPKLYQKEVSDIKKRFRNAEVMIESGIIMYNIVTDKQIDNHSGNLCFQLEYSSEYDKNKNIKVYLLTPDLKGLLGVSINDFPYVATDDAGENYLDLLKTVKNNDVSGIEVIRKLYEWLQLYSLWQKREISIKDIKLN